MMHALAGHRASPEEIEELHRILNAYKGDDNGNAQ
jgi:hypothetical protein